MTILHSESSQKTRSLNDKVAHTLPFEDREDFKDVARGQVTEIPDGKVLNDKGELVLDINDYSFLTDDAPSPETVNPSLWRQSQLNKHAGLFKVTDRLYQVRNNNMANLTIVEGDDGLIIIDTTSAMESAKQGLDLFRQHVSDKPVVAVIYTHTHIDHYGGIKGVVSEEDVASGKVPIIAPGAPGSFDKYALGENVAGGNAMSRRASYAFGSLLPHDTLGTVGVGVGISSIKNETVTYISPTDYITKTGDSRKISGLTFEFLYAPDTEAPEEMHIWIPELKALTCAENANHLMHNIQTLRGARTRDARNFARYLDETLERWGDQAEVHYGPHTWPVFGNKNVVAFLESQRDMYKFIHDQAMRWANKGLSPIEAAEIVRLPDSLNKKWFNHGYHGTLNHNVKAVFAKELGWWNGDPVTLFPLPEVEESKRFVDFVGADKILTEGHRAIDAGDYRWAVQLLHKLVFAQPDNTEAKNLQADAYEQMGYEAEGPQWRNIFLSAAKELREGIATAGAIQTVSEDTVFGMPMDLVLDFAAIHVDADKADGKSFTVNLSVTDIDEQWHFWVGNSVLNARRGLDQHAPLTLSGPKKAITAALLNPKSVQALISKGAIKAEGDTAVFDEFVAVLDDFDPSFPIVTP